MILPRGVPGLPLCKSSYPATGHGAARERDKSHNLLVRERRQFIAAKNPAGGPHPLGIIGFTS